MKLKLRQCWNKRLIQGPLRMIYVSHEGKAVNVYCHHCRNFANYTVQHVRRVGGNLGSFNIPYCNKHAHEFFDGAVMYEKCNIPCIAVDKLKIYPHRGGFCHMISAIGGSEHLHNFAEACGIKRAWFHNPKGKDHPHYDLRPLARIAAINNGARPFRSTKLMLQWLEDVKEFIDSREVKREVL